MSDRTSTSAKGHAMGEGHVPDLDQFEWYDDKTFCGTGRATRGDGEALGHLVGAGDALVGFAPEVVGGARKRMSMRIGGRAAIGDAQFDSTLGSFEE